MADLNWQEPPPVTRGNRTKWSVLAEQLREHPGRWALVATRPSDALATYLRRRRGLEATCRKREDGQWDVYARWPKEED
jgi:hypothetical protein